MVLLSFGLVGCGPAIKPVVKKVTRELLTKAAGAAGEAGISYVGEELSHQQKLRHQKELAAGSDFSNPGAVRQAKGGKPYDYAGTDMRLRMFPNVYGG
jgi:hypothetical protein